MEKVWSIRLIRLAAIFGLIGAVLGSDMAGSGNYQFRAIHAHMLVVGWLSVFAWGLFYKIYRVRVKKLVSLHGWMTVIGSVGLTIGMLFYNVNPLHMNEVFTLITFIAGGTALLVSFSLFIAITFLLEE
ncbi:MULTISPECIES: hypothetical protein [Bacillales]|uniref:Cytochrome-c oxidase n=1 Tax=Lysinibacillus louembei TaxID=1470088 RepID=A0ABZ0RTA3_9BACI|nr:MULTISPECIES: hypothetical protein [Bacillales]MCT6925027.1 hypothetical protein [Metasolibacillus sp.]MCT6941280.1 hypothetical protein [Metasolibacillus sp.]WPK10507.1 hypothetical protein R6U77_11485 [Lysinibacillus louembei]